MPSNRQVGSSRYQRVGPGIANPAVQFNDGNTATVETVRKQMKQAGDVCLQNTESIFMA